MHSQLSFSLFAFELESQANHFVFPIGAVAAVFLQDGDLDDAIDEGMQPRVAAEFRRRADQREPGVMKNILTIRRVFNFARQQFEDLLVT